MDLEDAITFHKHDFPRTSFRVFQDMRKNGELCDVIITVRNSKFAVHRVVLAAGIPFLRSVFADNALKIIKAIDREELDSRALESLIDYAYTGEIHISLENVQTLLVASKFWELTEVTCACAEFLSKRLVLCKVSEVWRLALSLGHSELAECCKKYLLENPEEFSETPNCLNVASSNFGDIILENDICVSGEGIVFVTVVNQEKASPSDRNIFLPAPLKDVSLNPTPAIHDRAAVKKLITNSADCTDLTENAKRNHLLPNEELLFLNPKTRQPTISNTSVGIYAICHSENIGSSVFKCDLVKGTWKSLVSYEEQRSYELCCAVATNENIYLFCRKTMEKINLRTLDWQEVGPTQNDNRGAIALLHDNMIYLFGSFYRDYGRKIRCFHTLEEEWLQERKMESYRWDSAAAILQDSIYVTGGFYFKGWFNADTLRTVEKYDPALGQSQNVANMLFSRGGHGCASMNGKIYVCGGWTSEGYIYDSGEVYDPVTNKWNKFTSMKTSKKCFSLLSHNAKIYSLGGENSVHLADSQVYNPETDEWEMCLPVPEGFRMAVSVAMN